MESIRRGGNLFNFSPDESEGSARHTGLDDRWTLSQNNPAQMTVAIVRTMSEWEL